MALTNSERQAKYRQKKKEENKVVITVLISQSNYDNIIKYMQFKDITHEIVFDRALMQFFRKR